MLHVFATKFVFFRNDIDTQQKIVANKKIKKVF